MRIPAPLVLVLVPVLSAACCCGRPPLLADVEALAGRWTLAEPMPTGSALGELREVALEFTRGSRGGHVLAGTRDGGGEITAVVGVLSAPEGEVRFRAERAAPPEAPETGFAIVFAGAVAEDGTLPVRLTRASSGAALGDVVFRRPPSADARRPSR